MGMLLRRNRGSIGAMTTQSALDQPEKNTTDTKATSTKDEKPKTIKRGRPSKT